MLQLFLHVERLHPCFHEQQAIFVCFYLACVNTQLDGSPVGLYLEAASSDTSFGQSSNEALPCIIAVGAGALQQRQSAGLTAC